jgi:hypothetical protein
MITLIAFWSASSVSKCRQASRRFSTRHCISMEFSYGVCGGMNIIHVNPWRVCYVIRIYCFSV